MRQPSSLPWTATLLGGSSACSKRSAFATCAPSRLTLVPAPGSTTRACLISVAPSDTRKLRNHVKKTVGKPYAGKPHVRIERGMGNQVRSSDTAPLTTNGRRGGVARAPGARSPALGDLLARHHVGRPRGPARQPHPQPGRGVLRRGGLGHARPAPAGPVARAARGGGGRAARPGPPP